MSATKMAIDINASVNLGSAGIAPWFTGTKAAGD